MKDPLAVVTRFGEPATLEGQLHNPAFLVGAGPSVNDVDKSLFRERGVFSLAINQVAAWVPVDAWCHSDPHIKFHHGLFLDQKLITFTPKPRFRRRGGDNRNCIAMKLEDGFHYTDVPVRDCPNTYGFDRNTQLIPEEFLSTTWAHWGPYYQPNEKTPTKPTKVGCLCTMLLGLRLLHYLGVRRIYLIGVDYDGRDGLLYGFPSTKRTRTGRYPHEQKMLELIQPTLERAGVEVFNCSPTSKCTLYPHVSFEDAVQDCKGSVPDEPFDTTGWYAKNELKEQAQSRPKIRPKHY